MRQEECLSCKETGKRPPAAPGRARLDDRCLVCKGTRVLFLNDNMRQEECLSCKGTGKRPPAAAGRVWLDDRCPVCKGARVVILEDKPRILIDVPDSEKTTCPRCDGSGKEPFDPSDLSRLDLFAEEPLCRLCRGSGWIS